MLQRRFGVIFLFWSGDFQENCRRIFQRILMGKVFREFFGLLFPGFQPPPAKIPANIHAQNRRHSSPISLSRTQDFFTPIFCLQGRPRYPADIQADARADVWGQKPLSGPQIPAATNISVRTSMTSGPHHAMPPRCAMRFESHPPPPHL